MLKRVAIHTEQKVVQMVQMAAERGIHSVVTSTCKVMGMKALQASNTSLAMARALRQEMPNDAGISLQDYFKSVCARRN